MHMLLTLYGCSHPKQEHMEVHLDHLSSIGMHFVTHSLYVHAVCNITCFVYANTN